MLFNNMFYFITFSLKFHKKCYYFCRTKKYYPSLYFSDSKTSFFINRKSEHFVEMGKKSEQIFNKNSNFKMCYLKKGSRKKPSELFSNSVRFWII